MLPAYMYAAACAANDCVRQLHRAWIPSPAASPSGFWENRKIYYITSYYIYYIILYENTEIISWMDSAARRFSLPCPDSGFWETGET